VGRSTNDKLLVLVVENHTEVREMLGNLVRTQGWEPLLAEGVTDAVAILRSRHVDAIIADWELDDGDGRSLLLVAGQMRKGPIPSVMVSSYASEELRRLAREAGAIDLLEKPFRMNDLTDALSQQLNLHSATA
jgi:DNA-binding response OmpR family regulator